MAPSFEATLSEHLQGAEELLPFARAVVQHLSRAPGARKPSAEIADRVGSLLASIAAHEPPSSIALADDPEIVASFFQNADLLAPERPLTKSIATAVMVALEKMSD